MKTMINGLAVEQVEEADGLMAEALQRINQWG